MTTLKEKISAKFEVDESKYSILKIILFKEGALWRNDQLKSEVLPILLECVEALEFYTQARMIFEPGNTRQCEITHESDYSFYPNHDVALEALERLRKWSEGEKN